MDTLLSMKVLVAVVDHASFVQAAEHLGLSRRWSANTSCTWKTAWAPAC